MEEPQKQVPRRLFRWLVNEIAEWQKDGLINEGQAHSILQRYGTSDKSEEAQRHGKLVAVLAILGSVLLGVGVILFFAANWPVMPRWVKVGTIFTAIFAAYAAGYWLAFEKKTYPKLGHALILLGSLFYGAGIWLIAQIFHINAHYPNGILFWAVGILPVAFVTGSIPILVQSSLLLTLWTIFEQGQLNHVNLAYLPLAFLIMAISYKLKSRPAAGLTLLGIVIWAAIATALSFRSGEAILFIFLMTAAMGMLIFSLGRLHQTQGKFADMKAPYRFVGLAVFFLSLYILTFAPVVRFFRYNHDSAADSVFFMAAFSITVIFIVAANVVTLVKDKKGVLQFKPLGLEAAFILTVTVVLTVLALLGSSATGPGFLIITNLLIFFAIVIIVVCGYLGREAALINFGLVFFVLDIIARYFDFFWDMLNKSVFFMAGGLLLLAGGFLLERSRRKIISEMSVKSL